MLRSNSVSLGNHVVSLEAEKGRLVNKRCIYYQQIAAVSYQGSHLAQYTGLQLLLLLLLMINGAMYLPS